MARTINRWSMDENQVIYLTLLYVCICLFNGIVAYSNRDVF